MTNPLSRPFLLALTLLCAFYLGFELFFNAYTMLSVDEFWFAHRIYQYKDMLPYRDFAPYKTVLGYYLLLPPLLIGKHPITALIVVKQFLAVLNTVLLLSASIWLRRFFSGTAILASLAILISSELVLCYSTQIRVDLLGYWFCFFSFLFLLENRFILAGLLLGLGFAATQKAIWYIFASNLALGASWLLFSREKKSFLAILRFNITTAVVISFYLLLFSVLAGWHTVIHSVFYEASIMYKLDWYDGARKLFWSFITLYNPLLFLLAPLTFINVLITYPQDKNYANRFLVSVYALAILICLIPYKQVFPYYMQVTIPVFLLLYTAFAEWLFVIFKPEQTIIALVKRPHILLFIFSYILFVMGTVIAFNLPEIYLLICMIPTLLTMCLMAKNKFLDYTNLFFNLIIISMLFVGGIYPLTLFATKVININGNYQKANINTMNHLLADGSSYIAGIELIYDKTQPIAGMRHLMGPAIDYLGAPSKKLRNVMLASLYEDPNASIQSVIEAFKQSTVKFYVNNYRMAALPYAIKDYLASEYEHWWGSIYLYSPKISPHQTHINIRFAGHYLIESSDLAHLTINGKIHRSNEIIYLTKGEITSQTDKEYRLKLIPDKNELSLNSNFAQDESDRILF